MKQVVPLIGAAALAVGAVAVFGYVRAPEHEETVTVARSEVSQRVTVTGKTRAAEDVSLSFQTTGRINHVYALAGETVAIGAPLAAIDSEELSEGLAQAQAAVASAEATLADIQNGATPEDRALAEARVTSATVSARDAATSLTEEYTKASTLITSVVYTALDPLFANPRTNPRLQFAVSDSALATRLEDERQRFGSRLQAYEDARLRGAGDLQVLTDSHLDFLRRYLQDCARALSSAIPAVSASQAQISAWQTAVASAQTSVNAEIAAIKAARDAVNKASTNLDIAKTELAKLNAGNTAESIAAQTAKVAELRAKARGIEAQLDQTTLFSPLDGVITKQNAKLGEVVTPGSGVVNIIGNANLEVEAYVPELSISKVALGNRAEITFDAYPEISLTGTVTYIDPAETLLDGVSNYKIKIALATSDPRLRSGLTAEVTITGQIKDNVIAVPRYALLGEKEPMVLKRQGKKWVATPLMLGLTGYDGMVEVRSGLAEGDVIKIPESGSR